MNLWVMFDHCCLDTFHHIYAYQDRIKVFVNPIFNHLKIFLGIRQPTGHGIRNAVVIGERFVNFNESQIPCMRGLHYNIYLFIIGCPKVTSLLCYYTHLKRVDCIISYVCSKLVIQRPLHY